MRRPTPGEDGIRHGISAMVIVALVAGCQVSAMLQPTPAPTFDPAPPAGWAWHDNPSAHREAVGQTFDFVCPADGGLGYLAGTDVDTDDSSVCTAAVHTGRITREAGGIVRVVVRPGEASYEGSLRNGILSESYGPWGGSFVIVAACHGDACTPPASPGSGSLTP